MKQTAKEYLSYSSYKDDRDIEDVEYFCPECDESNHLRPDEIVPVLAMLRRGVEVEQDGYEIGVKCYFCGDDKKHKTLLFKNAKIFISGKNIKRNRW